MYYYYYYYYKESSQINVELKFTFSANEKISLVEFNEFLHSISELHRRVIFLTQPEYQTANDLDDLEKVNILPQHELEVKKLCRRNPFDALFCFSIAYKGLSSYLIVLKLLVLVCKKYGKDYNSIQQSVKDIKIKIKPLIEQLKKNFPKEDEQEIESLDYSIDDDKHLSKIEIWCIKLLTHQKTQKFYNQFCTTIFTIDKLEFVVKNVIDENEQSEVIIDNKEKGV